VLCLAGASPPAVVACVVVAVPVLVLVLALLPWLDAVVSTWSCFDAFVVVAGVVVDEVDGAAWVVLAESTWLP